MIYITAVFTCKEWALRGLGSSDLSSREIESVEKGLFNTTNASISTSHFSAFIDQIEESKEGKIRKNIYIIYCIYLYIYCIY